MAVIPYTIVDPPAGDAFPEGTRIVVWSGMATGDTGTPYTAPNRSDKSVSADGTFGGATVTMEGSNDVGVSPTFYALRSPDSVALTFTVAGLKQVLENSWKIRPNMTAGAGSAMVVRMLVTTIARR